VKGVFDSNLLSYGVGRLGPLETSRKTWREKKKKDRGTTDQDIVKKKGKRKGRLVLGLWEPQCKHRKAEGVVGKNPQKKKKKKKERPLKTKGGAPEKDFIWTERSLTRQNSRGGGGCKLRIQ